MSIMIEILSSEPAALLELCAAAFTAFYIGTLLLCRFKAFRLNRQPKQLDQLRNSDQFASSKEKSNNWLSMFAVGTLISVPKRSIRSPLRCYQ